MIKSLSTMTVYQLRMECKKLKIRRYSKLRKKELRELVENHYRKQQVEKLEKDETIFCYPEILKEIYSFVDFDNTDLQRKKLISNVPQKIEKLKNYLNEYSRKQVRCRRQYLISIGYGSFWSLKDDIIFNEYLTYSLEKLMTSKKEVLYKWLKGLQYKVTKKIRKKEMKDMVKKYYTELYE